MFSMDWEIDGNNNPTVKMINISHEMSPTVGLSAI